MSWLNSNRKFFHETVRPILKEYFPLEFSRCACLVDGMGSEVQGREDDLSYDHQVIPRIFILLKSTDYQRAGKQMQKVLSNEIAKKIGVISSNYYFGHGIVIETVRNHFSRFIALPRPPRTPQEWLFCHDQDLIHITNGEVYHDPVDLITSYRKAMAYFPRDIWKKKIADYCIQYTLAANFNLNRCVLRGDYVGAKIFLGLGIRRALELTFLLDRRYAPYEKWLYPLFKTTTLARGLNPALKRIAFNSDWNVIINEFTKITDKILKKLENKKLVRKIKKYKPKKEYGYKLLYIAAWDILNGLPKSLGMLEISQHQKYSQLNDRFMYALTRNQMLAHIHAPSKTWGTEIKPRCD